MDGDDNMHCHHLDNMPGHHCQPSSFIYLAGDVASHCCCCWHVQWWLQEVVGGRGGTVDMGSRDDGGG